MTKKALAAIALVCLQGFSASAEPYCAAVRGNGESMPAHWGALAIMMETYGSPKGMAGGSSASISTFLWESAMMNPLLSSTQFERGNELALVFKSLEGVTYHLYQKPEWHAFVSWVNNINKPDALMSFLKTANSNDLSQIKNALTKLHATNILYGPAIRNFATALNEPGATRDPVKTALLQKRLESLKNTIAVFGKFDAKNDAQIFVRDGLIDFRAVARYFGALADFMSLRNADAATKTQFSQLLANCLSISKGRTWSQIAAMNPSCQENLGKLVDQYFASYTWGDDSRAFDKIGASQLSIVTTSVISGDSANRFRKIRDEYTKTLVLKEDFHANQEDVRFGYWGMASTLNRAQQSLSNSNNPLSQLDKSKRFLSLGEATWIQALSLSPAEPGLSAALEFSTVGLKIDALSFGGWSDLHPVPLLKAAGCEKVVYVTRRGGDSLFSQGTVKRLLNLDNPTWDYLDSFETGTRKSVTLNNNGSRDDQSSTWSMLYNLRNPRSSFAASLKAADAVVCTNWNSFDAKKNFSELIEDSYRAPIFESTTVERSGQATTSFLSMQDNRIDQNLGYSPYAGCIPLE